MMRNNNAQNHLFLPPSPTITFIPYPHNIPVRVSAPVDSSINPPKIKQNNRHMSNAVEQVSPNNAFTHLRNQISNLRSEFTRLIQKDSSNITSNDVANREERNSSKLNHKEERQPVYSTIGLLKHEQAKPQEKAEYTFNFNSKPKGPLENLQFEKTKIPSKVELNQPAKYNKKYSFQMQERKEEVFQQLEHSRTQLLQLEIRKLGEIKFKAEDESLHLKRALISKEEEMNSKITELQTQIAMVRKSKEELLISNIQTSSKIKVLETQNSTLKSSNEQLLISLSLKNGLVEKLQKDNERHANNNAQLLGEYSQKIQLLQKFHQQNISMIDVKFQKARMDVISCQMKFQQLFLEHQTAVRSHRIDLEKLGRLQTQIKNIQNINTSILQKLSESQQRERQFQRLSKLGLESTEQKSNQDELRIKAIEQENNDFRKRVQSYKKTVEQLNSANNNSREKILCLKEQIKRSKEESKRLSDDLLLKQSLITSLYRDINILDNEIRLNAHMKAVLGGNLKYIDELNHQIITLECQRLSSKYTDQV